MADENGDWHFNGWTRRIVLGALASALTTGAIGTARFARDIGEQMAKLPEWRAPIEARLSRLETGETTPMARETREKFNANAEDRAHIWNEIEELRRRIENLEHRSMR